MDNLCLKVRRSRPLTGSKITLQDTRVTEICVSNKGSLNRAHMWYTRLNSCPKLKLDLKQVYLLGSDQFSRAITLKKCACRQKNSTN